MMFEREIMSPMARLFIAFFLISMHPSNARFLPAIHKATVGKLQHLSISLEVVENVQYMEQEGVNRGREMLDRSSQAPAANTKQAKEELMRANDLQDRKINNDFKAEEEEKEEEKSGSDPIVESSSPPLGLLKATKLEGSKKAAQPTNRSNEVFARFTDNSCNEIAVTDYQPPHRKTPIHN